MTQPTADAKMIQPEAENFGVPMTVERLTEIGGYVRGFTAMDTTKRCVPVFLAAEMLRELLSLKETNGVLEKFAWHAKRELIKLRPVPRHEGERYLLFDAEQLRREEIEYFARPKGASMAQGGLRQALETWLSLGITPAAILAALSPLMGVGVAKKEPTE